MTGYTVHTGSSETFSSGWDHIFGGKKTAKKAASAADKKAAAEAAKKPSKRAKKR